MTSDRPLKCSAEVTPGSHLESSSMLVVMITCHRQNPLVDWPACSRPIVILYFCPAHYCSVMNQRLEPKLITVFREGYSSEKFIADLIAGLIVGIVALPLAIAFAIASGV